MQKIMQKTLLPAIALLMLAGCNKSKDKAAGEPPQKAAGTPAKSVTLAQSGSADAPPRAADRWEVRVDQDGRKWFGNVPYDVFFDDPLSLANDDEPVIAADDSGDARTDPAGTEPGTSTEPPTTTEPDKPAPGAGADKWSSVITAEALDAEVKSIRNFLNPKLQSVGQYNANLAMIPMHTATLAALAGVAAEHDGDISWKADALYIRDLAGAMNAEPLQRGPKFQRDLLGLFEQISDTLNRSRPADLPEPDPEADLVDSAEMRLLMKRMDDAYKTMKTNAGSEDSFRSSLEMVRQQSAVLAALSKVVTLEGYGYADDGEFKTFANTVMGESVKISEAVALESFTEYDKALTLAYQACTQCHTEYKE